MTAEEHNRVLGICHLVYGGLTTLLTLAMLVVMWAVIVVTPTRPGAPDAGMSAAFLAVLFAIILIYTLIFILPSLIAGYAMLKHKPWARTASIVAGVSEAMSFPVGIAVAIYSFWFMFSDVGKSLYGTTYARTDARPYALRDAPPQPASDWNTQTSFGSEREYAPPAEPPDWRNQ